MIEEDVAKYVNTVEIQLDGDISDGDGGGDQNDGEGEGKGKGEGDSEDLCIIDVIGDVDVEKDLYLDNGVEPDWMS